MIEFRQPIPGRKVIVALRDGKPIAKASYYFHSRLWLVQSMMYGKGLDVGGKPGVSPGVKGFPSLRAILAAAEKLP